MDTDTHVRISWEIIKPYDQDALFLKVLRYTWKDPRHTLGSWYLTKDGWRAFQGYDVLDFGAVPHLTGFEQATTDPDWWEKWVRGALVEHGFADDAHNGEAKGSVERLAA